MAVGDIAGVAAAGAVGGPAAAGIVGFLKLMKELGVTDVVLNSISGFFGGKSQAEQNALNRQLTRETNALTAKLQREGLAQGRFEFLTTLGQRRGELEQARVERVPGVLGQFSALQRGRL